MNDTKRTSINFRLIAIFPSQQRKQHILHIEKHSSRSDNVTDTTLRYINFKSFKTFTGPVNVLNQKANKLVGFRLVDDHIVEREHVSGKTNKTLSEISSFDT